MTCTAMELGGHEDVEPVDRLQVGIVMKVSMEIVVEAVIVMPLGARRAMRVGRITMQ